YGSKIKPRAIKMLHNNFHNKYLNSFARRQGRKLSNNKEFLLENKLSDYSINLNNLESLYDYYQNKSLSLEIGFGMGDFLGNIAAHYPNHYFIGCEPYINGVANLLEKIVAKKLNNIKIFSDDARLFLERLNNKINFEKIFILFPDPWPKKRHLKRRIVQEQLLNMLARNMLQAAELIIVTDDKNYAQHIYNILNKHCAFDHDIGGNSSNNINSEKSMDITNEWFQTKYYQKTHLNKNIEYIRFYRNDFLL
ncbi:MAG: tRNA (guanosine(46)-N7)-methyltransferase TrmB, partial [Pseudomonadota bacterium]